jgi:hypothetical protein
MGISQVLRTGALTVSTVLLGIPAPVYPTPSTYEGGVDALTDELWWQLRPNLRNQKIRADQVLFRNEWRAIRRVVRANSISFSGGQCFEGFSAAFVGNLDDVADAIFYVRYPQLAGRKIRPGKLPLTEVRGFQ